ncbi:3D domain-containing protein, partial [Mitsuokella multacida]
RTVKDALLEQGYNPDDVTASPGMDAKIHSNMDIAVTDSAAAQAITEPEPAREQVETSYGMTPYSAVYTMEATAYLPWDGGGDGITASGMPAQYGIAAVDTDVIPLGTRLYIPGYGEAIAADTGGAIVGDRIDLCMEDYGQAMDFGRRYVTVYVLD